MTISGPDQKGGTPVILRSLTLRVAGRTLLENAQARFEPGQITLIVGPSGAGKSTLLRVLAGLVDSSHGEIEVSPSVSFGEEDPNQNRADPLAVGLVFQRFALFDELSPDENACFAWAHRPRNNGSRSPAPNPEDLLTELQVPRGVPTSALSGGEQQRLAIARTLAYDPAIILYDEPTSGLDMATAEKVARLIRRIQDHHRKTSIIVTHDFETLTLIADRVYFLDSSKKILREVAPEQWKDLGERMRSLAVEPVGRAARSTEGRPSPSRSALRAPRSTLLGVGMALAHFFSGTTGLLEELVRFPARLLPLWKSGYWGLRFCLHYLRLVAGPLAMLYVAIAGMVAGFVATYFTFRYLPYRPITEPLVLENVLESLGFALYRILVPVLITLLVAARCGAAVASDVGGKVYGQQVDALRTLGIQPQRYLLTPILYSFLLGTPVLALLGFWLARFTSLCVFTATHPQLGPYFWDSHFHRGLFLPGHWLFQGTGWLVAKVLCCAAGIGWIAYLIGMRPKRSTRDVSAGITLSILLSTIYVLLVQMGFALFEFD